MAYVNGAAAHEAQLLSIPIDHLAAQSAPVSPERLQKIRELLSAPFDPSEIKWRVTATSTQQTKHGAQKRGQLIAYADQRAYTDRLNEVFGEWGWTRNYDVQVAQNFERRAPCDKTQTAVAAKVVVVSKVIIHGLGGHTGVGEEWADDENAATRAEAQAFKRACACFGLGRYLYDLDKTWVDLDQHNRPVSTPSLPEWARPGGTVPKGQPAAARKSPVQPRQSLVRDEILGKIRELRGTVGRGLSQFVLDKYAGGDEPEKLGHAKLTAVFDKLADIEKGVERLRKASGAVGDDRHLAVCRELNLPSDSIEDIPDRQTLKNLVERLESGTAGHNGNGAPGAAVLISEARGRLLQAARKAAETSRKRLADIISEATSGSLSLESLKNLSDADLPAVLAATARIAGKEAG